MKRFLIALLLAGGASLGTSVVAEAACVTNVSPYDTLNVRSGPGTRFRVVDELGSDYCRIRLLGEYRGSWGKIRYFRGRVGWVHMDYIDEGGDGADSRPRPEPGPGRGLSPREFATGWYCPDVRRGDSLNARSGPGTGYPVVGSFNRSYCRIRGNGNCRGVWCETDNHEFSGWVNTRYLRNSEGY